jgi:hypothetical protein
LILEYVFRRKLRGEGRCEINGETILIKIPGARDQMKVLHTLLLCEVRHQRFTCKNCDFKAHYRLAEEVEEEETGERLSSAVLVDPATSEDILRQKELIEELLPRAISNPRRLYAFLAKVLEGFSANEIAAHLHVKPNTVRKWYASDRRAIKSLLAILTGKAETKCEQHVRDRSGKSHTSVRHPKEAIVSGAAETNRPQSDVSNAPHFEIKPLKGVR